MYVFSVVFSSQFTEGFLESVTYVVLKLPVYHEIDENVYSEREMAI